VVLKKFFRKDFIEPKKITIIFRTVFLALFEYRDQLHQKVQTEYLMHFPDKKTRYFTKLFVSLTEQKLNFLIFVLI
jgi:hypothetical protein